MVAEVEALLIARRIRQFKARAHARLQEHVTAFNSLTLSLSQYKRIRSLPIFVSAILFTGVMNY